MLLKFSFKSFLKTLLPYKYDLGTHVPYYGDRHLPIVERCRDFGQYSVKCYKLKGIEGIQFTECLITYYLEHPPK